MLPRVLETEAMDSAAEAHDYNTMDHAAANAAFVADLLRAWDPALRPVLDVGTGPAQIPLALCRCYPDLEIVAVDLAEHMLRVARGNVVGAGLAERIHLERCDAKRLPFRDGAFAAVISNSIAHHIPDPRAVLAEMVRVRAPGGLLFVRDLLRPDDEATLRRLVDRYAVGANDHQRQMFTDSLHAALTLAEVRGLVAGLGFDPAGVRQTSDRHWTWQDAGGREP
jgi:ubiquinone/menaquinone biosynthesis C-methylase UbiE